MKIKKSTVFEIFERLEAENPNPQSDLKAENDYTFCIAVLLSAQTTDKMVNKVTQRLFKAADTPEKMIALGEEKVREFIRPLGFFSTKAQNVIAFSTMLIEKYSSKIPDSREELEKFPGIGRKSANVILNHIFKKDYIAVDTHVLRVSKRLCLSENTTPLEVENDLLNIVPKRFHQHASDWLVLHGRYVCTARMPKCAKCCLLDICPALNK